jgi:hypothetical protein
MLGLTRDTRQLIDILFGNPHEREIIEETLKTKCAENISFRKNRSSESFERIHFAIIKLLHEGENLEDLVKQANTDWRDLLVNAGFGNDLKEHNTWKDNILHQDDY